MRRLMTLAVLVFAQLAGSCWCSAAESFDQAIEEAAIRQAVEAYVAAYNRGDAAALAALWSPEAVYTDPLSGEQLVGRQAIQEQFAELFKADKRARLEATTDAVRFVSPNVAIERGTATVVRPEQPLEESIYSAVYIQRDGQWLLDRVTEEEQPTTNSHYDQLKELQWMIGNWVDEDQQARVETNCHWTKNQNFLVRSFTVSVRDRIDTAGMQIIGWHPAAKQIRSWVFDSAGGFGEGMWSKQGNAWHIRATGTLPDGSPSSALNILTYINDDTFTWQSIHREVAGELLPNVDEVVVVRQRTGEQAAVPLAPEHRRLGDSGYTSEANNHGREGEER